MEKHFQVHLCVVRRCRPRRPEEGSSCGACCVGSGPDASSMRTETVILWQDWMASLPPLPLHEKETSKTFAAIIPQSKLTSCSHRLFAQTFSNPSAQGNKLPKASHSLHSIAIDSLPACALAADCSSELLSPDTKIQEQAKPEKDN